MSETVSSICPNCGSDLTYPDQAEMVCTQCEHHWLPSASSEGDALDNQQAELLVYDSNGNQLQNGDTVIVAKDLPVKGAPKPIKSGTKVKNIRLVDSDDGHNIDCKIDGFGAMSLKSEFVKKV